MVEGSTSGYLESSQSPIFLFTIPCQCWWGLSLCPDCVCVCWSMHLSLCVRVRICRMGVQFMSMVLKTHSVNFLSFAADVWDSSWSLRLSSQSLLIWAWSLSFSSRSCKDEDGLWKIWVMQSTLFDISINTLILSLMNHNEWKLKVWCAEIFRKLKIITKLRISSVSILAFLESNTTLRITDITCL